MGILFTLAMRYKEGMSDSCILGLYNMDLLSKKQEATTKVVASRLLYDYS